MLQFTNLTGKKETKSYTEPVVIARSTKGEFNLAPMVQKTMGVVDGDFIINTVLIDEENPNAPARVFLAKGINGVSEKDENGNEVVDTRGRVVYLEGQTGYGAIARPASNGSSLLKFSGSAGWVALGLDEDHNTYYTLGEGVQGQTNVGSDEEPVVHTAMFFELIFKERKAKSKRTSSTVEEEEEEIELQSNDQVVTESVSPTAEDTSEEVDNDWAEDEV